MGNESGRSLERRAHPVDCLTVHRAGHCRDIGDEHDGHVTLPLSYDVSGLRELGTDCCVEQWRRIQSPLALGRHLCLVDQRTTTGEHYDECRSLQRWASPAPKSSQSSIDAHRASHDSVHQRTCTAPCRTGHAPETSESLRRLKGILTESFCITPNSPCSATDASTVRGRHAPEAGGGIDSPPWAS